MAHEDPLWSIRSYTGVLRNVRDVARRDKPADCVDASNLARPAFIPSITVPKDRRDRSS
jgi:hypothetical protein